MINKRRKPSGDFTPWGAAQHIEELTTKGCYSVSTASHGGYLIPLDIAESRIPQKVLNELFATPGRYLGDYYYAFEEDCDVVVFLAWFPENVSKERQGNFIFDLRDSYLSSGMLDKYNPDLKMQCDVLCDALACGESFDRWEGEVSDE